MLDNQGATQTELKFFFSRNFCFSLVPRCSLVSTQNLDFVIGLSRTSFWTSKFCAFAKTLYLSSALPSLLEFIALPGAVSPSDEREG